MPEPPLDPTPGQTIGPFFGYALPYAGGSDLVPANHPDVVRLTGRVLDGAGAPVPDALVEIWQAGPDGRAVAQPGSLARDGWTFTGWGRADTDAVGRYSFRTLVPGATAGRAPFVAIAVFARGLLDRLFTRAYLPGAVAGEDPLLARLTPERRATLMAARDAAGFVFDIVLQGGDGYTETVFLSHRDPA